jgi:hypothetical protein
VRSAIEPITGSATASSNARDQQHGAYRSRRDAKYVGIKEEDRKLEGLPVKIRSRISQGVSNLLLE